MSLAKFANILKFNLSGGEPTAEEKTNLFKEAVFMVLARATSADTNIDRAEVNNVQQILKRVTGEDISAADIRVGASSDLFEKEPLDKYLSGVGQKIDARDRVIIMHSLAEVVRSDGRISHFETDYFDMVAHALGATPSELIGLVSDNPQR